MVWGKRDQLNATIEQVRTSLLDTAVAAIANCTFNGPDKISIHITLNGGWGGIVEGRVRLILDYLGVKTTSPLWF